MCVAAVSRAGDVQLQSTELSLSGSSASDTNTNQLQHQDSPFSQFFLPHAPNTFQLAPNQPAAPPVPRPQVTIQQVEREKELLDRRKNWVFMTPEEMMGTDDPNKDAQDSKSDKDHDPQKPTTVMERYYQHLFDADQQKSTNKPNKFDADIWTKTDDNPFRLGNADQNGSQYGGQPGSTANMGVFQSIRADAFPDIFHTGTSAPKGPGAILSPEQVRQKAEQEAHMESFKQLWDIDQPKQTTATVISTPTPAVHINSDSPFSSDGSQQSTFNASTPSLNGGFSPIINAPPEPQTITTLRAHSSPPHSDFKPTSSPF
ncbi:MAG TPA: hypothetical protein VN761_11340 [Candidatus Polarisedimenticolia bacterium]|nr:hypothetical protein [Candidatus Polarisedimenticolia bacterium]